MPVMSFLEYAAAVRHVLIMDVTVGLPAMS